MQIYAGLRVLDLTRVIAGPLCTQMLADLGAEVFKIERPGQGDDSRRMAPLLEHDESGCWTGESTVFLSYNRGKKSLTVDFTHPDGAEVIRSLAATCDVFVENFKTDGLRKYGLDYESIKAVRPDIIYCSITGFGQSGPYAHDAAYDFILQAMAGPMSTCGRPDGSPGAGPLRTAIPIIDMVAGLHANAAISSALYHRARTGEGQHIDTSLLDCGVALNGHFATSYLLTGSIPRPVGNSNPIAAPSEVIECRNGAVVLGAGNDMQFSAICRTLGIEEVALDPRFVSNAQRIRFRSELTAILTEKMGQYDRDDLIASLRKAGVPCGPINDMAQVFADPQVMHNGLAVDVSPSGTTSLSLVKHPVNFSRTPAVHRPPPKLGADTRATLKDELGLTEDQLQKLASIGSITLCD